MWKLLLFNCLLASVLTQSHAKDNDKSSSIYDTESHEHNADSDSGISESGLSDSVPSARVTKKPVRKATLRSSKFPLQFAQRVTKDSEDEEDEAAQTVGKKIYKDVGYRKNKFEKVLLKEKRKASTRNPNKKHTTVTKRTKKPYERRVLENASDLNFPSGLFTDMPALVATGRLGSQEIQIDKSKAGQILADLKEQYRKELHSSNDESDEPSINQRTVNPIFLPSNETANSSEYDDEYDEEEEDHEDKKPSDKQDVKKDTHKKAGTIPTTSEEYDDNETPFTTLTESGKVERAYHVLSKLKNETNIHVETSEREQHKKIILDTLRRQGLSNSDEEILDVVSHYDSVTEKIFAHTRPSNLTDTQTTKKKGILYSIEKAYERALKDTKKNKTRDVESESKEYSKFTLDKKPRSDASRERRKKEKKEKRKRQKEEREKEKKKSVSHEKKGDKENTKVVSGEKRKPIKERPLIPKREDRGYERRRFDSRERYRGRYEPRDRYRERYSRERYRGRYDSRARYGDRQRFDSRERYRERDRPRSRERYRPRYDSRERYRPPRRDEERETRGQGYGRREEREPKGQGDGRREERRDYRPEAGRPRYSERPPFRDRMTRKKWYSEEGANAKRVYPKRSEERTENRDGYVRNVRNAGRSMMNKGAPTQGSFSREYPNFATNDEQNSAFKNFMKSKKLRDLQAMGEDVVTIP